MAVERKPRLPVPPEARGWELLAPEGFPSEYALDSTPVYIGRGPLNEINLPFEQISRDHLMVEWDGGAWVASDLGSRNGTLLNGRRISSRHRLNDGDRLTMFPAELIFRRTHSPIAAVFVDDSAPIDDLPTVYYSLTQIRPNPERALGVAPEIADRLAPARLAALIRAGTELSGTMPRGELFRLIVRLACQSVNADLGALALIGEDGAASIEAAEGENVVVSCRVRDRVLERRAALLIADTRLEPSSDSSHSLSGIQSLMAAPLQTPDAMLGLIYVASTSLAQSFSEEDLSLLTVYANIAAAHIERARNEENQRRLLRHRTELEQAAEVWRRLFPACPPAAAGVEIAARSEPSSEIGGDFYSYFQLPGGRTGILLADVAGHGLAAALLASTFAADVHCLSADCASPGQLLERLNGVLAVQAPNNRFVTCVLAAAGPGRLEWANAGHCRPLLLRADGEFEVLEGGGLVLGLFSGARFETMSRALEPGDRVVFFSDGIVEAENAEGEQFGEERLRRSILESRELGPQAALDAVWQALAGFLQSAPHADDMTCVIVSAVRGEEAGAASAAQER